jgi:membrane protein
VSPSRLDGGSARRRRLSRRSPPTGDTAAAGRAATALAPASPAGLHEDGTPEDGAREDLDPTRELGPERARGETAEPEAPTEPVPHLEHIPLDETDADGPASPGVTHPTTAGGRAAQTANAAYTAATDAWSRGQARSSSAVQAGVQQLNRRRRKPFWVLIGRTLSKAWRDRILGLAAEAGFWQLLSLPPLLLAVFGTIGYVGDAVGHNVTGRIEDSLLNAARHVLTGSTVLTSVQPMIEDVLRNGRPDVISVGFLLSLWSGSTAMSTYVNTITIAYGERDARSAIRSRLLALRLYLAQVLTGVVLLPGLILGPTLLDRLLDQRVDRWARRLVTFTYWPLVAVLSLAILTSLYHLSVPHRRPWRRALPGALLALTIWLVGCYGLRYYVSAVFNRAVVYGTLAAPVAVLLFFYITAFAVLLGAEFNATLDLAKQEREQPPRVQ